MHTQYNKYALLLQIGTFSQPIRFIHVHYTDGVIP